MFGHDNFHYFIPSVKFFVECWGCLIQIVSLVGQTEVSQHFLLCSQCILIYY